MVSKEALPSIAVEKRDIFDQIANLSLTRREFIRLALVAASSLLMPQLGFRPLIKAINGHLQKESKSEPNYRASYFVFGPFADYNTTDNPNPAQLVGAAIEVNDAKIGSEFCPLVVDFTKGREEVAQFIKNSPNQTVVILAVGGNDKLTIETSASNRFVPNIAGFSDVYKIQDGLSDDTYSQAPIDPDLPIDHSLKIHSDQKLVIENLIEDKGWEDVVLTDSAGPDFWTPCNAVLYEALRNANGKNVLLVHLPFSQDNATVTYSADVVREIVAKLNIEI